jgi:uncharacterized protein YlxW (UPF0749 family)
MDVRHIRLKMSSWVAPITMVCFVIGALLALQFTTQRKTGAVSRYGRADVLTQELVARQNVLDKQREEISDLRAKLDEYRKASTQSEEVLTLLNKQLTHDQVALGLVKVRGPGVVMTLDDSTLAGTTGENKEPFLVHDYDLWPVVNELRAAGAEVISINGQRVIGTTAIRCVGPVLKVNDVPVAAPFEVKAIGDAAALSSALNLPGGVVEQFQASKFPVKVETRKEITIEAVSVTPKVRYAEPVPPEE